MQPATESTQSPTQPRAGAGSRLRAYDAPLVTGLCALLLACYAAVVYVLVLFGGSLLGAGGPWLHLLALLLVGVGWVPVHRFVRRGVHQLIDGWPDDPYGALSRLNQDLERAPGAGPIPEVVATIASTLKLPYVAITAAPDGERVSAGTPPEHAELFTIPLAYGTTTVGALEVAGRRPGESLSAADLRLLHDLARQVGITLHAARLGAALQASREQLVLAREEERRRIRRDLHDGLGPTLGSLPLKLDLAADLIDSDPAAARKLLSTLKEQTRTATSDVRRLVHALRPPTLDELGLLGAIREQAARYAHDGLTITVLAPQPLGELPAAVEVAAYRIVQEALTNMARHAAARSCVARLTHDPTSGQLQLEIVDDGRGLAPERHSGVGLQSMRERAEELGGSCIVETLPAGGTRVYAGFPLAFTDGASV